MVAEPDERLAKTTQKRWSALVWLDSAECLVYTNKTKCLCKFYFLGLWMLIEGITLLMKTSNRALRYSGSNRSKVRNQKLLCGWGLPAVLVGLGAGIGFATNTYIDKVALYEGYSRCWLSNKHAVFYATAFGPLCLTYTGCVFIFGKVLFFIYGMSKDSEQFTPQTNDVRRENFMDAVKTAIHIKATLKSFGLLFFILGIPLIFSFLTGKLKKRS